MQLPKSVTGALLGAALVLSPVIAKAQTPDPALPNAPNVTNVTVERPAPKSTLVTKPLSLTLGLGFPDAARLGVEYNLGRFFSIGGNVGTAGIFRDYGVHARVYPFDTHRFHFYLQGGADALDMTPLSPNAPLAVVPNLRLGEEFRAENGFTIGVNVGAGVPVTAVQQHKPVPAASLYLGWSF